MSLLTNRVFKVTVVTPTSPPSSSLPIPLESMRAVALLLKPWVSSDPPKKSRGVYYHDTWQDLITLTRCSKALRTIALSMIYKEVQVKKPRDLLLLLDRTTPEIRGNMKIFHLDFPKDHVRSVPTMPQSRILDCFSDLKKRLSGSAESEQEIKVICTSFCLTELWLSLGTLIEILNATSVEVDLSLDASLEVLSQLGSIYNLSSVKTLTCATSFNLSQARSHILTANTCFYAILFAVKGNKPAGKKLKVHLKNLLDFWSTTKGDIKLLQHRNMAMHTALAPLKTLLEEGWFSQIGIIPDKQSIPHAFCGDVTTTVHPELILKRCKEICRIKPSHRPSDQVVCERFFRDDIYKFTVDDYAEFTSKDYDRRYSVTLSQSDTD